VVEVDDDEIDRPPHAAGGRWHGSRIVAHVLVYRSSRRPIDPRERLRHVLHDLQSATTGDPGCHERLREVCLALGEIEAGVADALSPDVDEGGLVERRLRMVVESAGALVCASWRRDDLATWRTQYAYHAAERALQVDLPPRVEVGVPEGYAYYSLYPESYIDAACHLGHEWPEDAFVCVVGVRSIGTSLSAMVVAGLGQCGIRASSWTVRPRGHPFAREIRLSPALEADWRQRAKARWVVVDEGPGQSGSSLAGVADCLVRLGVDPGRIVLMPHWAPDPDRFAPAVAATWRRHRVVPAVTDGRTDPTRTIASSWGTREVIDLSGGRWRRVFGGARPIGCVIDPSRERRKWLVRRDDGAQLVVKFAGLGPYGARVAARAQAAADAGFAPRVAGSRNGLIAFRRVHGRPLPGAMTSRQVGRTADYLVWAARAPVNETPDPVRVETLVAMAGTNVRELLGPEAAGRVDAMADRFGPRLAARPARRLDGHLCAHEWIVDVAGTLVKTDGSEHDDDHFFPGPCDPTWDVAALIEELRLPPGARDWLVARVAAGSRDPDLARLLPIYRVFYLAFRAGATMMSAGTLPAACESTAMARAAAAYRERLAAAIDQVPRA
jgi:hypothetical protein